MADRDARRRYLTRTRSYLLAPVLTVLRQQDQRRRRHEQLVRVALGTLMAHQVAGVASSCEDAEFSAFSQFGEDGVIEYLIRRCDISPATFVEIGVEDYEEANTRFLAEHRLWRGLIVDQNPRLADDLAETRLNWRAQVRAASAFVTRENVRDVVAPFVAGERLGILSIDIDGSDYWVLEELVELAPAMIVVEYNSLFGSTAPVTIPYDAGFDRTHGELHSVYYGASLAAFDHLLAPRGYALVGCTSAGNNAFFVHSDHLGDVPSRSVADAYRPRHFAEHRAADGSLSGIVDTREQLHDVRQLPLVDVRDGRAITVADLLRDLPG